MSPVAAGGAGASQLVFMRPERIWHSVTSPGLINVPVSSIQLATSITRGRRWRQAPANYMLMRQRRICPLGQLRQCGRLSNVGAASNSERNGGYHLIPPLSARLSSLRARFAIILPLKRARSSVG